MRTSPHDFTQTSAFDGVRVPRVLSYSRHGSARSARRNVARDAVDYVLAHGRVAQRTGVMFVFLGRRDVPRTDLSDPAVTRLVGTTLLIASDGEIVTVYRNTRAWRTIQHKTKYRSAWRDDPSRVKRLVDGDDDAIIEQASA